MEIKNLVKVEQNSLVMQLWHAAYKGEEESFEGTQLK